MAKLKYAVHAYAWTGSWSNKTLDLIDRAKRLGFDMIEIPLMEVELVDPAAIRKRLDAVGIGVCTSTVLPESGDITADDQAGRQAGLEYLKQCIKATAEMGATVFTGVTYSALGRKIASMPDESYWERAAKGLKEAARYAQPLGVTVGIEPVNRYETFLVNTCDQALRLREMIGEPNVAVHLDAYHMNVEENSFYQPTKKAAPHLCHYHLSESHRGTPGTGLVDWDGIYRALAETGYQGSVGLESFIEVSPAMAGATCIWRRMADSSDQLLTDGLRYLKGVEAKYYG
ncbi:MAG: sugar phosphate isomerase/epimerase family protein [Armatimonadota bacterium]